MRNKEKGDCSLKAKRFHLSLQAWGYLFMAPFLLSFVIFTAIPIVISVVLSLFEYNMYEAPVFVGLSNYRTLFMNDPEFTIALRNTMVYAFTATPISFVLSFLMAWLLNSFRPRLRNIMALAFYAPSMTSGVTMSIVWLYLFSGDRYGLINHVLINLGLIHYPIQWTTDTNILFGVVIFIGIWMGTGTAFLTFLAGFQALSPDIYEAGMIDGIRNRYQELIYLTLPQMKPQLLFGAVNAAVAAFAVADIPMAVAGFPSPDYAAHTLVLHMNDYGFTRFEMGYASAISVVLFAITFASGRLFMKIFSSKDL